MDGAASISAVMPSVLLVGPKAPPSGGMAVQAQVIDAHLRRDGYLTSLFPSNFPFPRYLRLAERIPVVRLLLRAVLIWPRLWKAAGRCSVVHVLAASWLYFFVVVAPAVLVSRMRRKRVVVNYRGGEAAIFFRRYGFFVRPVLRIASVITAPSGFLADILRQHFGIRTAIVPNILDFGSFHFRQRTTFQPRLLVTRQLEELYDIETVLRAFRAVQEDFPEATLWIAGAGSRRTHLETLAEALRLHNVWFLGHVPHAELPAIYEQCDILLNASRADNFPGSLMEASAAGLVVVSTGVGGIPYIYENGRSAFLVGVGDWQAMAAAVRQAVRNPNESRQMVAQGLACARRCEWDLVKPLLLQTYGFAAAAGAPESGIERLGALPCQGSARGGWA